MQETARVRTWEPLAESVPAAELDPGIRPAVMVHVRVHREGGIVRKLDLGGRVATLDEDSGQTVTVLFDHMDGARDLRQLAGTCELPLDEVITSVQQLYELAVVQNVGEALVPPMVFHAHICALELALQSRLGEAARHFLPAPTPRSVLGSLIEAYHFVLSNPSHVSPAIMNAPNERIRMMWSEYLSDEYWHGVWLRKGLRAAGLSDDEIVRADPLPSTLAVISFLKLTSIVDPIAYAVCLTAGESLGDTLAIASGRFDLMAELVGEPVVQPFREHQIIDLENDHNALSGELFAELPPLTRKQQASISRTVRQYHQFVVHQEIETARYYNDASVPVPFTAEAGDRLYSTGH
jgi:hypothetical protein